MLVLRFRFYCPEGSDLRTKLVCPVGHYCLSGSVIPSPCPPSTYNPSEGLNTTDCLSCTPGMYTLYPPLVVLLVPPLNIYPPLTVSLAFLVCSVRNRQVLLRCSSGALEWSEKRWMCC